MIARLLAVVISTLLSVPAVAQDLRIYHFDVEQGDATLIISPDGRTLLFDAGNEGKGRDRVVPRLQALGVSSLDFTVLSHYDADHVGGLDEVILGGFAPVAAYDRGDNTTRNTIAVQNYFNAAGPLRRTIQPGEIINLGAEVIVECVAVNGVTSEGTSAGVTADEENESSIALVVRYRDFDYFIAGDLTGGGLGTKDVESLVAPVARDVDVLHVGHHGSPTSTNQALVDRLKAEAAIISVGYSNTYGHPDQAVLDRLTAPSEMLAIWVANRGTPNMSSPKMIVAGNSSAADGEIVLLTNGSTQFSINGVSYAMDVDNAAPQITAGPSVANNTISWTTNEPAEAIVEYGVSASLGSSVPRRSLASSHQIQLTGLLPATTYFYRAGSVDGTGNGPTWSAISSFTTPAGSAAGLVINELASYGSDADEWVELFNNGDAALDLGGYSITDNDGHTFVLPALVLPGRGYVVITSAASGNDDTDASDGLATFHAGGAGRFGSTANWNNDGDDVVVRNASGAVIDVLLFGSGTGIDPAPAGTWTNDVANPARPGAIGVTIGRYPNGMDRNFASDWRTLAASSRGASNGGEPPPPPAPPIAEAGAPISATEGVVVNFDGSGSAGQNGATIVSYFWDFGDGNTATGINPTHTYADDGSYAVTLTVTDSNGMTDVDGTSADVWNAAPVVDAGGPYAAVVGQSVVLSGVASDADALEYSWNFGDGSAPAAGASATHTYTIQGTYTAVLTVTDDDGASTSASTSIVVDWAVARPLVISARNNATATEYDASSSVVADLNDAADGGLALVNSGTTRWFEARFASPGAIAAIESAEATISYRMVNSRWAAGSLVLELWSGGVRLGTTSLNERTQLTSVRWNIGALLTPSNAQNLTLRLVNVDASGRNTRVDWAQATLEIRYR